MWKGMSIVAALVLVGSIYGPSGITALPQNEIDRTYYSGPDFKTQVGELARFCDRGFIRRGSITPYFMVIQIPCDPLDPNWPDPVCSAQGQIVECPF